VPTQQIAAARLRARETGRFVAQAAPTGISAIMTPTGAIITRSAIQQRVALQATIMLRRGLTPYARFNDAPALALFALIGVGSWLAGRRRRT
jgi:apolipoprotein N-acyltransferase